LTLSRSAPNEDEKFYFRLTGTNLYYSRAQDDMKVLGAISVDNIESANEDGYCFKVGSMEGDEWKMCAGNAVEAHGWVCDVNKSLGLPCDDPPANDVV